MLEELLRWMEWCDFDCNIVQILEANLCACVTWHIPLYSSLMILCWLIGGNSEFVTLKSISFTFLIIIYLNLNSISWMRINVIYIFASLYNVCMSIISLFLCYVERITRRNFLISDSDSEVYQCNLNDNSCKKIQTLFLLFLLSKSEFSNNCNLQIHQK